MTLPGLRTIGTALTQLRQHKLRTALTLLGMVFGVGAVIAMLSIGEGAKQEALKSIDAMGLRNLVVEEVDFDQETLKEVRERSIGLNLADVDAALSTLPMVEDFSARKQIKHWSLFSHHAAANAQVTAVTPGYFEMAGLHLADGRYLLAEDMAGFRTVAVLGAQAARDLFPDSTGDQAHRDILGQAVKVNHQWFTVAGVLAERDLGKSDFAGVNLAADRNRVFIPLSTAHKRLKFEPLESELDAFRLRLTEGADPQLAARTLDHLLSRRHGDQEDYRLIIPAALLKQEQRTQQIFTIVMSAIAGISLLVGGIGIMNIMLATVLERKREIGLLRALGARRSDIQQQFLVESAVVSAIGALIGIGFGIGLALVIQQFAEWPVAWTLWSILLSVLICLATGILFGWYPARQAAALDPIKALQSD